MGRCLGGGLGLIRFEIGGNEKRGRQMYDWRDVYEYCFPEAFERVAWVLGFVLLLRVWWRVISFVLLPSSDRSLARLLANVSNGLFGSLAC